MFTPVRSILLRFLLSALLAAVASCGLLLPSYGQKHRAKPSLPQAPPSSVGKQISGMYTFLREGEFVQITVEDGRVSGFVSRFGERGSDRGAVLDQFFSKAALEGKRISFTTKPVHGTWFEFTGLVSRGEAKTPNKEDYWSIRGTLKQYDLDENKNVSARARDVTFKSFPQDLDETPQPAHRQAR